MRRRTFLEALTAGAALSATSPADAANPIPVKLGFDTYSVRAWNWKADRLIDYAAGLKLDTIQISSLGDFENHEPAYLQKLKDKAARLHMQLDAGMGCICPLSKSYAPNGPPARQRLLAGLRVAKGIGAKCMRCFQGAAADRFGQPGIEACMQATIKLFRSVKAEAQDLGVKIALENHSGDMQAREVKTIIEESGRDFVASNLDTGNPMWVVEDPFVTLETLAPYVVTTHIRDSAVFEVPRGAAAQWVVLGDGSVDFVKFTAEFRRLCPQASMQMEVITGRPPTVLPYLEAGFWKVFPKTPAWEFARFLALAKSGRPYMGAMVIEDVPGPHPQIMLDALREQQKTDLERSLEYARKKLNVGVNWRI